MFSLGFKSRREIVKETGFKVNRKPVSMIKVARYPWVWISSKPKMHAIKFLDRVLMLIDVEPNHKIYAMEKNNLYIRVRPMNFK